MKFCNLAEVLSPVTLWPSMDGKKAKVNDIMRNDTKLSRNRHTLTNIKINKENKIYINE